VVLRKAASSSSAQSPVFSDTLVMQNYGYFQLKANAGLFRLSLAEGRAKELFEVVDGWDDVSGSHSTSQELLVAKKDFYHSVERLYVRKKKGKEKIPLLDDLSKVGQEGDANSDSSEGSEEDASLWSTFSHLWGGSSNGGGGDSAFKAQEKVHVFSLATGALYERMLKIMMLSVTKRTSVPVKFWLLENFLSPAFKVSAQALSHEFGFEVSCKSG